MLKFGNKRPGFFMHSCRMIDPFSTNVPLLCPLKISENFRFPDVFKGIEVELWLKMG